MEYTAAYASRLSMWKAFVLYSFAVSLCLGDVRYSFPEEMKRGSVVGKIAQDLGVDRNTFSSREPRIEFDGKRRYCEINAQNGELVINERIDREELCGQKPLCTLYFDFFMENPLELHRVTLEIQDINDNNPTFPHREVKLDIPEFTIKGSRFSIDEADADVDGAGTLCSSYNYDTYLTTGSHTSDLSL